MDDRRSNSRLGKIISHCTYVQTTQPPNQCLPEILSPEREDEYSPPPTAEIKIPDLFLMAMYNLYYLESIKDGIKVFISLITLNINFTDTGRASARYLLRSMKRVKKERNFNYTSTMSASSHVMVHRHRDNFTFTFVEQQYLLYPCIISCLLSNGSLSHAYTGN
jgi:hypothetical protein